jgi:hypothetical protein
MKTIATSSHRFHIPVMGTGFTLDTPIKVAPWGIDSVISLVDDDLLEKARLYYQRRLGILDRPIAQNEERARERRTTAYLNVVARVVAESFSMIANSDLRPHSALHTYFGFLPEGPAKSLYREVMASGRHDVPAELARHIVPGRIDVNIMTKLDRATKPDGSARPPHESDAVAALLGFAESRARGAVIFSAGFNPRLFGVLSKHPAFASANPERKEVILKVSDLRSATVQARYLAKNGIWVDEFRVESPINCGGHAFVADGTLLGDILTEFRDNIEALGRELSAKVGWSEGDVRVPRVTVQGGLGVASENDLLAQRFGIEKTGWGSPFLLVPEVVAMDLATLARLEKAGQDDIVLSSASPLGVPFWQLITSESEEVRRERIAAGRPGSPCIRGHAALGVDARGLPICPAARTYQKEAIASLEAQPESERSLKVADVTVKSCICYELGGSARRVVGDRDRQCAPMVCPGPNLAYFNKSASFREMVDHIYGRVPLTLRSDRPHFMLKEAQLYFDVLKAYQPNAAPVAFGRIPVAHPEKVRERVVAGLRRYAEWNEPGLSLESAALAQRFSELQLA